jgi:hypothetical protein
MDHVRPLLQRSKAASDDGFEDITEGTGDARRVDKLRRSRRKVPLELA